MKWFVASLIALAVILVIYQAGVGSEVREERPFATFAPQVERRSVGVRQPAPKKQVSKPLPKPAETSRPEKPVAQEKAPNSQERFEFLCKQFLSTYMSDQDLLIDANSSHFMTVRMMVKTLKKVKKNYERLSKRLEKIKSSDVCAADELEKYLETLMEAMSLRRDQLSRAQKRYLITGMLNISTLQFNQGNESFSLYIMYKLIEHKLISQEFMGEIMRLQKDHTIFMDMKYSPTSKKEETRDERQRFKSDVSALILLILRTLY